MSPESITFELDPRPEDYAHGFALMYRRRQAPWRVVCRILLPILVFGYFWLIGANVAAVVVGGLALVWVVWLMVWGNRYFSGVLARRAWKTMPSLREHRRYRISEAEIAFEVAETHSSLAWRLLVGFSRDQHGLILYDGPTTIRVFPSRVIGKADLDHLEAFARKAGLQEL